MRKLLSLSAAALALAALVGCGGGSAVASDLPTDASAELAALRGELEPFPEAAIVLHGLRAGRDTAFHQYKLVWHDPKADADSLRVRVRYTDWTPIAPSLREREEPLQGMAVWTKRGGQADSTPVPPVYAYVGDERYGSWEGDEWVAVAQYALLAEALDELGDLAERKHRRSRGHVVVLPRAGYEQYRANPSSVGGSYRARYAEQAVARPAPAGTFDAKVRSRTANAAPAGKASFVERAQARQAESSQRFDDKVKARMNGGASSSSAAAAPPARPAATPSAPSAPASGTYSSRPSGTYSAPSYSSPRSSGSSGSSYSSSRSRSSGSSWGSSRRSGSRRRN